MTPVHTNIPVYTNIPVSQPLQPIGINVPSYYQTPATQFTNINYQPVKFAGTTSTMPSTTLQGISSINYAPTSFQYAPSHQISSTYVTSNQQILGQNIGNQNQLINQGISTQQVYSNYQNVNVNGKD